MAFSCTLRMGELLGLTWDCVDISTEAIEENRSYIFVNKEVQRIKKSSLDTLDAKDILYVFVKILYLIFDYLHKYYTFKHFEA